jgi:hypothetical protein
VSAYSGLQLRAAHHPHHGACPGQHLFISAVSKAWRDMHKRVGSVQTRGLSRFCDSEALLCTITSQMTLYSAVFASASRVNLAHENGLVFDNAKLQRISGKVGDIITLQAACGHGLQLTDEVLIGAADAASVPKLQWLHTQQGCPLPRGICDWAAKSGSIDTLKWLKEQGSEFTVDTTKGAAAGAHIHVLQFLRDEGCEWDQITCSTAAWHGHLSVLRWLYEQTCPWHPAYVSSDAAYSGSIEMLVYLKQQGCVFNEEAMIGAAAAGQLAVCEFLVAEQCPSDTRACAEAARGGHLETVRILHESGCPCEVDSICVHAAESGSIEVLRYLKQQECALNAQVVSTAAAKGHTVLCEFLRAEQCPWDASACWKAAWASHVDTLCWLHESGCPWDIQAVRVAAAESGDVPTIEYALNAEPAASAEQLTQMLNAAGRYSRLRVVKWLRQQGAEWPAVLRFGASPWSTHAVQWARDEGCTSPTTTADA